MKKCAISKSYSLILLTLLCMPLVLSNIVLGQDFDIKSPIWIYPSNAINIAPGNAILNIYSGGKGAAMIRFYTRYANPLSEQAEIFVDGARDNGLFFRTNGNDRLVISQNGNVYLSLSSNLGLGTDSPQWPLHIKRYGQHAWMRVDSDNDHETGLQLKKGDRLNSYIYIPADTTDALFFKVGNENNPPTRIIITRKGLVGINTEHPASDLDVNGITTTKGIAIVGGADIAEHFPVNGKESIAAGSIVVIDPECPGKLKKSEREYDRCVAGITSGAGNLNPGLTLADPNTVDDDLNVSLAGKVYALASAVNGSIKPGDLLTTSNIPGHAMKVTDYSKAQGAIIGKAMTSLENGEGKVLVLVSLQ